MRQGEEEEEFATKISYQKSLCVDRIQKAWNKHIDGILESSYCLTANLGRDTLRTLAALAESEPISRVKPILISCIHQRASKEPHDGQSRAKRLTRVDVLETKDIIEQENRMPRVNQPIRKKRALFDSRAESAPPDSPAAKHARLRRVTFKVRTGASNSLDALRTSHGDDDLVSGSCSFQSFTNGESRALRLIATSVLPPRATAFQDWKSRTSNLAFRIYSIWMVQVPTPGQRTTWAFKPNIALHIRKETMT